MDPVQKLVEQVEYLIEKMESDGCHCDIMYDHICDLHKWADEAKHTLNRILDIV